MYSTSSSKSYCNEQDTFNFYQSNQNNQSTTGEEEFEEFLEASRLGDLTGIKNFLQKFCFLVNNTDANGFTALMYAASYGHYNIIKSLLEYNADSNLKELSAGRTALMMAASNGHTRCIEMLVQGKADIRLKDNQGYTAAYYATHYGHGGNKIIARLLNIPGNANNQYNNNTNYNNCMNSSLTKHQNGHMNSPTANYSNNERYNMLLNHHNNSLNDENDLSHYGSFNTSADQFSHERRYSNDTQSSQMSNSMISNSNSHQQTINDILKRTQPKPRALFKQRPRQQLINAEANANNGLMNKETIPVNKSRYSFGHVNQIMQTLEQHNNTPSNGLRSGSLSLDLTSNLNSHRHTSPNGYSPDQTFGSTQKSPNLFQYDSVFHSPHSSGSDHQSFTEKSVSRLEASFLNLSWNDPDESTNKRNKPRNSTFVYNENSNQPELPNSPILIPNNSEGLEVKYSGLPDSLPEFLQQNDLEELAETLDKAKIGLYSLLLMSETELRKLGVKKDEDLAALIAGQLKYKEYAGIKTLESMNFACYLGNKLEKVQKELDTFKMEQSNLHSVK